MRMISGIVFGVAAALLIVAAFGWADTSLYPLPTLDDADTATMANIVTDMPFPAKVLAVLAWLFGALGGAWLGLRVCDRQWVGWTIVAVVIAAALVTVATLQHPLWMQLCAVLLPITGGTLAARMHRKPYPGEALLG